MKDAPAPVASLASAGERVEAAATRAAATRVLNEGFTRDDSIAGGRRGCLPGTRRGALQRRGMTAPGQGGDAAMTALAAGTRAVIVRSCGCRMAVRWRAQAARRPTGAARRGADSHSRKESLPCVISILPLRSPRPLA